MDEDNNLLMSNNRGCNDKKPKKKKCSFNDYKKNAINSLNEVEFFLNNLDKAFKCFRFYNFFNKRHD